MNRNQFASMSIGAAVVLILAAPLSTAAKSIRLPYGGSCKVVSKNTLTKIRKSVIRAGKSRLKPHPYQWICAHNLKLIRENGENVLKVVTKRGDGIGNKRGGRGWSDIKQANRRRFELHLDPKIRNGQAFMFEYSVRVPKDIQFMEGNIPDVSNEAQFYIFQLKSNSVGSPVISAKVSQSQGISALGYIAQKPEDFGKWVKIRIEFKPTRKQNGFSRLWVNDKPIFSESGYRTVWSGEARDRHSVKFGIYQLMLDTNYIKKDTHQSMEFKNIRLKRIKG